VLAAGLTAIVAVVGLAAYFALRKKKKLIALDPQTKIPFKLVDKQVKT
jgi:hypothetical protein